jgi:hypothetical protein
MNHLQVRRPAPDAHAPRAPTSDAPPEARTRMYARGPSTPVGAHPQSAHWEAKLRLRREAPTPRACRAAPLRHAQGRTWQETEMTCLSGGAVRATVGVLWGEGTSVVRQRQCTVHPSGPIRMGEASGHVCVRVHMLGCPSGGMRAPPEPSPGLAVRLSAPPRTSRPGLSILPPSPTRHCVFLVHKLQRLLHRRVARLAHRAGG